jgi:hypothetical protein
MEKELIEKRIVELATSLTDTTNKMDKYIIKLLLNYYVNMALKNNN